MAAGGINMNPEYANYITRYIIPVLLVMAGMLIFSRSYNEGKNFSTAVLLSIGFLLGWASAFISLLMFF
jgi:hypothetical protein